MGANGRVRERAKATYDLRKWFYEKMSPLFGPTDCPILDFWGNMDHLAKVFHEVINIVQIRFKRKAEHVLMCLWIGILKVY